jgi:hypothetical protein
MSEVTTNPDGSLRRKPVARAGLESLQKTPRIMPQKETKIIKGQGEPGISDVDLNQGTPKNDEET